MDNILLPILIFAACATALSVGMLGIAAIFGPKRDTAVKEMPYESGMDPIHDAHRKFDVRFHLVAIAFLIFDVELLFLYPWAVASRSPEGIDAAVAQAAAAAQPLGYSRGLVFGEVMVFVALLGLGLVYAWRRGVFKWR
ncbi:MAG: NADH-quinone oxidoreductase subunit A [Pirellulaceae bacterium]